MSIYLTNGAQVLELPRDLIWVDELTWSKVAQKTERGIFGTLIIDAMARNGGSRSRCRATATAPGSRAPRCARSRPGPPFPGCA